MTEDLHTVIAVVIATLLLIILCGVMGFLIVANASRRHKHRAKVLELEQQREKEVMLAEREATEQTLTSVGRELHDNVGQLLQVAQMGLLNNLEPQLAEGSSLAEAMDALEAGLQEVKRLGRSLNDDLWRERSLEDALKKESERMERLRLGKVDLRIEGSSAGLADDRKTILFRSFQEVINNALKHSRADKFTITMSEGPPFTMSVADHGIGFDPEDITPGGGLINIKRRCALIDFTADLVTAPGEGCRWTFTSNPTHVA